MNVDIAAPMTPIAKQRATVNIIFNKLQKIVIPERILDFLT